MDRWTLTEMLCAPTPEEALAFHNNKLPKDPKRYALCKFIEKFGHEYLDVPIASDARGTCAYSRYKLRDFLHPLLELTQKREGENE